MNVDSIAIYSGDIVIYWSSLIIALGIASGFFLAMGIYTAQNSKMAAMWVFLPFAVALSVLFCRIIHWYCHEEQYASFLAAVTDYTTGGYVIQGALLGTYLAALLPKLFRLCDDEKKMLDAIAPGLMLTFSLVRLSSLFNTTCRSKYSVENSFFQRLPFAVLTTDSAGNTDYRFATFFVEFLILLFGCMLLIILYYRYHNARMKPPCERDGHIFRIFLVLFGAVEAVLDSTRNDASFMHVPGALKAINKAIGFVSFAQICFLFVSIGIMAFYLRNSIRANGMKGAHVFMLSCVVLSLTVIGVAEYCIQRYQNLILYAGMSLAALVLAVVVFLTYKSCIFKAEEIGEEF